MEHDDKHLQKSVSAALEWAPDVSCVNGISNQIQLATQIQPVDVKHEVEDAMKRDSMLEAAGIQVAAENHTITLSGHVRSWHEREVAERGAWSAPCVTAVVDRIAVY